MGYPIWYLTDKLGSVRENVDGSGNVLDSITYDTYGNILAETHPTSGDRFKYTSREWDSEIGQYFYRARYYSAGDGRFESEDPSAFSSGDTDLYRYVHNDPTILSDPTGLEQIPDTVTMEPKGPIGGDWSPLAVVRGKAYAGDFTWGMDYKVEITDSTGAPFQGKASEVIKTLNAETKGFFKEVDFAINQSTEPEGWHEDSNGISQVGGRNTATDKAWAVASLRGLISKYGGWGEVHLEQYFVYGGKVIKHSGFEITMEVRQVVEGYRKSRFFIYVKKKGQGWENKDTGFDVAKGQVRVLPGKADGENYRDEII
jgi:RHS repeat-associated protein